MKYYINNIYIYLGSKVEFRMFRLLLCETNTVKVFIHLHQKMFMNILCALLKLFKGAENTVTRHDCRDHSSTIRNQSENVY